jgi:hypothetical protein
MRTPGANGGVGEAAKSVAEHASQIARLELELAAAELKRKAVALGVGAGLLAGSLVFGVFMLAFALATASAALALVVSWWLALLIVTAVLGALATTLGLIGLGLVKKGSPPVPKETIREAKLTTAVLKR